MPSGMPSLNCTPMCTYIFLSNDLSVAMVQVAKEAEMQLVQLVTLLKLPAVKEVPSSITIVAVRALGAIAAQRPQYLGRVLPTLLALATSSNQNGVQTQSLSGRVEVSRHLYWICICTST